jgi:hypothetical protein
MAKTMPTKRTRCLEYRRPLRLSPEEMAAVQDVRWRLNLDTETETVQYLVKRGLQVLAPDLAEKAAASTP